MSNCRGCHLEGTMNHSRIYTNFCSLTSLHMCIFCVHHSSSNSSLTNHDRNGFSSFFFVWLLKCTFPPCNSPQSGRTDCFGKGDHLKKTHTHPPPKLSHLVVTENKVIQQLYLHHGSSYSSLTLKKWHSLMPSKALTCWFIQVSQYIAS